MSDYQSSGTTNTNELSFDIEYSEDKKTTDTVKKAEEVVVIQSRKFFFDITIIGIFRGYLASNSRINNYCSQDETTGRREL